MRPDTHRPQSALPRALLFDLDGTLLDSVQLILASYHHTLAAHEKPPVHDDALRGDLGTPLAQVLARFASDAAETDAMMTTYRTHNALHHDAMVRLYDGIEAVVHRAAEARIDLAIVTNKSRAPALRGLEVTGIDRYFHAVVSADDVERHKPNPAPVRAALHALDANAEDAIFIGDSPHDLSAGTAAGVKTAIATWGPFERAAFDGREPDHWLAHPQEIANLID